MSRERAAVVRYLRGVAGTFRELAEKLGDCPASDYYCRDAARLEDAAKVIEDGIHLKQKRKLRDR